MISGNWSYPIKIEPGMAFRVIGGITHSRSSESWNIEPQAVIAVILRVK